MATTMTMTTDDQMTDLATRLLSMIVLGEAFVEEWSTHMDRDATRFQLRIVESHIVESHMATSSFSRTFTPEEKYALAERMALYWSGEAARLAPAKDPPENDEGPHAFALGR